MTSFEMLEYGAWGLSALFGLWMLFDLLRTDRSYSEELLTSSREGEIEDALVIDPTHQGGHR
jgi:hypothetical protein